MKKHTRIPGPIYAQSLRQPAFVVQDGYSAHCLAAQHGTGGVRVRENHFEGLLWHVLLFPVQLYLDLSARLKLYKLYHT